MKDLFIRRVYSKQGINVVVELDFIKKTVSLVERDGKPKEWQFMKRTPDYMEGWLAVLGAMEYAVTEAMTEMQAVEDQEHQEFIEMYARLDQSLKSKKDKE